MKFFVRCLTWPIALLAIGAIVFGFLAIERAPRVATTRAFDAPQVARARALLAEHNPQRLRDGDVKALILSREELKLILDYMLEQMGRGVAQVKVDDTCMTLTLTSELPDNPLGRFVNWSVSFTETADTPRLRHLQIGRLSIPRQLAVPVVGGLLRLAYLGLGLKDPTKFVHVVAFDKDKMTLQYQWQTEIAEAVRRQLISPEDVERLHDFHQQLVSSLKGKSGRVSWAEIARPVFALGVARAAAGDPVADNRAALLVLSSYVSNRKLSALAPAAANWPVPPRVTVLVHRRVDLVKHFADSAALAATGGQAIAKTIGLFKEVDDSRGGSGFSFADLLADEAGTRFGKRATESRVLARELQKRAAETTGDEAWLPNPRGLQEQMSEADFTRRYGGVDGAGYRAVLQDIQQRIEGVALYR